MDILIFLKVLGNVLFLAIVFTSLTLTAFFYSLAFLLGKGFKNRQLIPTKWEARKSLASSYLRNQFLP